MLKTFENLDKSSCSDCTEMSCAVALLNKKQFEQLSDNSIESDIKNGEIIMRSDSLISNIIYLKTGYVKEFITDYKGKNHILQIIKHHTYLGLHSLFADKINHYSYAALNDLKVCYIDINIFKQLIKENGNFAYQILVSVGKENLFNYYRLINKTQKNSNGRLAEVLIYLAEDIFESTKFSLLLTRQELADLIGISRENAARVLSQFKSERIIETTSKEIEILNMDLLKKISKNG